MAAGGCPFALQKQPFGVVKAGLSQANGGPSAPPLLPFYFFTFLPFFSLRL